MRLTWRQIIVACHSYGQVSGGGERVAVDMMEESEAPAELVEDYLCDGIDAFDTSGG